jgi:hypothetical protein
MILIAANHNHTELFFVAVTLWPSGSSGRQGGKLFCSCFPSFTGALWLSKVGFVVTLKWLKAPQRGHFIWICFTSPLASNLLQLLAPDLHVFGLPC